MLLQHWESLVPFLFVGLMYLEMRRRKAEQAGEGYYGFESETAAALESVKENPEEPDIGLTAKQSVGKQIFAFVPLILVGVTNKLFITYIPKCYPHGFDFATIGLKTYTIDMSAVAAVWAIIMALGVGLLISFLYDWKKVTRNLKEGLNTAISGSLLATMNTGAEYGFGGIIAALPGFAKVCGGISGTFHNPLVNGAVTTSVLA